MLPSGTFMNPLREFLLNVMVCLTIAIVLYSCSGKEPPQQESGPPTLRFRVDSTLVETSLRDTSLGILFAPPKGWQRLSERILRRAHSEALKKIGQEESVGWTRIAYGFLEPRTASVITITRLSEFDTSDASQTIREYQNRALLSDSSATAQAAVFYHHGLKIHQLLTLTANQVNFAFVVSGRQLKHHIRIDFVFPRKEYARFARTVESVLGSVELL
jgi:hypothetical protein